MQVDIWQLAAGHGRSVSSHPLDAGKQVRTGNHIQSCLKWPLGSYNYLKEKDGHVYRGTIILRLHNSFNRSRGMNPSWSKLTMSHD